MDDHLKNTSIDTKYKNKKIKIYLCDFVQDYLGTGTYMFPLNIGYLAAWANKFFFRRY